MATRAAGGEGGLALISISLSRRCVQASAKVRNGRCILRMDTMWRNLPLKPRSSVSTICRSLMGSLNSARDEAMDSRR
jgi:hypothetical protein